MRQKGATIIELIIYTALMLSLVVVLTDIFSSILSKNKESVSLSEVEIDGKYISQRLLTQVALATSISTPSNLGDTSNSIVFSINSSNYSYYLTGVNLFLNDGVTSERLNSYGTEVSNFTIKKLGNSGGKPILKISFTVKSTILQPNGNEQHSFDLTVGTR